MKRLLFALLLLCSPLVVDAANRCTLSATGSCASYHATIQEAVDAANIGDRIIPGTGVYTENVIVLSYTNAPTLSPESVAQYGSNKADGVALLNYTTPTGSGCP